MQSKLEARPGMILTDGEIFGKIIFLGGSRTAEDFYEITEKEYKEIMEESDKLLIDSY